MTTQTAATKIAIVPFSGRLPWTLTILFSLAISHVPAGALAELTAGQRWVRSHPLTLMALTINPATFHVEHYRGGAGLNTMLAWKEWKGKTGLFEKSAAAQLPWHLQKREHHVFECGTT